jgi:hypothetical protein
MPLCKEVLLVAHLISTHFGAPANNENWGAGVQCNTETVQLAAGGYYNSFNRTSFYGVVGYEFVRVGRFGLGALAGVASGYGGKNDAAPLIGGLRATFDVGRFQFGVLGVPPVEKDNGVAHVTVGWRF